MYGSVCLSYLYIAGPEPVAVSFKQPRYYVNESSGSFDVTIVTSHKPMFSFTVKLTVSLGSPQAKHGKAHCIIYEC